MRDDWVRKNGLFGSSLRAWIGFPGTGLQRDTGQPALTIPRQAERVMPILALILLILAGCGGEETAVSRAMTTGTSTAVATNTHQAPSPTRAEIAPSSVAAGEAAASPTRTAVPTPSPAATKEPLRYTVHPGDNLTIIADRFSTTAAAIQIANNLFDRNDIYVGQELFIPQAPSGASQKSAPTPA